MVILNEAQIRELVDVDEARTAVAGAFRALHEGAATIARVISLPFADPRGAVHIKAGHIHEDAIWTAKFSGDFYPDDGGATCHSGVMFVSSAVDGRLIAVLLDNGYLTELRTGAAGAIAADLLAREDVAIVAIVGAGSQARYQLAALLRVRTPSRVHVASRSDQRAQAFVTHIRKTHGLDAQFFDSVEHAVHEADVVITTTPSTSPLVEAEWLSPGAHVTAVGSDEPTKQELAPNVFARADVIAVDDRRQAAQFGELHHAIESGLFEERDAVTLGELLMNEATGRTTTEEITVVDLTGVGVQDAAIAALTIRKALEEQVARLERREVDPRAPSAA
jgi:ornithine cyclodeaminase/alanine dehydrogenase-like protein (mu-crystallin family)